MDIEEALSDLNRLIANIDEKIEAENPILIKNEYSQKQSFQKYEISDFFTLHEATINGIQKTLYNSSTKQERKNENIKTKIKDPFEV